MSDPGANLFSSQRAQDQAVLPIATAFRLCVRGIETRLGRSVVTLIGVALGTAFLMSVLAGFHVKQAVSSDTERDRAVARRLAVLRGQVGIFEGKTLAVVGEGLSPADQALLRRLRDRGATVSQGPTEEATAVLLMGDLGQGMDDTQWAALAGQTVYLFEAPGPDLETRMTAAGAAPAVLSIELPPQEIERARRREQQALYRMYWVVGVSLLITVGGISNAMLMSVTERFREIATMKCLGALSGFVVKLFLIESVLLGLAGGVAGCLAGALFPLAVYGYTYGVGRVLGAVDYRVLGGYFLASVATGAVLAVVAGIYPARMAARMVPAAALRSEV